MEQQTFLQQTAQELLRRFGWHGLQDVALVFPMNRAGVMMREVIRQQMMKDGQTAVWAPEMLTLSDLFDSLCPLGKEEELYSVVRLYRLYRKHVPDAMMEIDHFYGWGRQLLADFTNIDEGLTEKDIPAFFRNALSLTRLDEYQLDEEVHQRLLDLLYKGPVKTPSDIRTIRQHFEQLWTAMPLIYSELNEQLLQENKGYTGQRMRYVVSHWPETGKRATYKTYCFVGFNYLLPVERELMRLLKDEQRALFFWDYVEDFRTNSKAFAFISRNLVLFPNALPAGQWGAPRKIKALSVSSVNAEAQYAGTWLSETYTRKGESTAVVICDETLLEPVIYALPSICIGDEQAQINITKGYPLRNTPTFAEVRKLLASVLRSKDKQPADSVRQAIAYLEGLSATSKKEKTNSWQWHLEREAIYQIRLVLMQFAGIVEKGQVPEITETPDLLERLITRCLEQVNLPFHGEPVTDLQLMGVLETRAMDFQHLLLLNVEEGVIPAHQPDKSFIPYYLRKAYGLQTHDERASVYAYNFFRLLRRAEDVTIVFSQSQSAMTKSTMSRFVMQMLVHPEEFKVSRFSLQESNRLPAVHTREVDEGRTWLSEHEQNGKPLRLSPSAINTFYTCKRRFYYENVLGIREEEEQELIFSANTTGTFVHEAMHYIYDSLLRSEPHSEFILPNRIEAKNTPEHRREAIMEAYRRMNNAYQKKHEGANPIYFYEEHTMENSAMDQYLQHLLQRDAMDAAHGLKVLMMEQKMSADVACVIEDENGNTREVHVSIEGRVDRMDKTGGVNGMPEQVRIVDYKSGKYNKDKMCDTTSNLRTDKGQDYVRQTLLYSYIAYRQGNVESIEPHLYFAAQDLCDSKAITRVKLDDQFVNYNDVMHKQAETLVKNMAGDILHEREYPRCEEKDCTSYCPFTALCDRHPKEFGMS